MILNEEYIKSLESPDKELVEGFLRFENELADFRFHRSEESDKWLKKFISYLQYDFIGYLESGFEFYRARKHNPTLRYNDIYQVFPLGDMGAPPRRISSEGRASAPGIPLLYGASNKETAAVEVRSEIGESISIATFSVTTRIKCLDFTYAGFLRDPVQENTGIKRERSCPFIAMLTIVNHLYSKPASNDPMKYVTSQVISEAIKMSGYQAIAFDSSRSESTKYNFVFLKDDFVKSNKVERFNVDLELSFKKEPSPEDKSTLDMRMLQGPPLNNGPGGFRSVGTFIGKTR